MSKDECDDDNIEVYPEHQNYVTGLMTTDLQIDNDPTDPLTSEVDADGDTQGGDVTVCLHPTRVLRKTMIVMILVPIVTWEISRS